MTQTTFAPPPALVPEQAEQTGGGRSRRTVIVAGGLAAALVLGAGGYFLLGGGGSSDDIQMGRPIVLPHATKPLAKKPAAPAKAAAKPVTKVPATSTVPIGRDPFHALYIAPATTPTGGGSTSTSTSTGNPAFDAPSQSGTSSAPPQTASYALTLVKVTGGTNGSAPIFTWNVGGTAKQVLAAQKFGRYGELVTLTWVKSSTGKAVGAVVQVGDDEPLAVRVGEKITVK